MKETIMSKRMGLGRGLSALMGDNSNEAVATDPANAHQHLELALLTPGVYQPRKLFYEENLQELSDSIRKNGVMQPIIVRPLPHGKYQIIAGERRWRASKMAELSTIPAIIKELTDKEALEWAIIENIQRQDLNPLEEAEGYQRLMNEFSYTQEAMGKSLGKSRSHIANMMRLLSLPEEIKDYIYDGSLSIGHARSLINAENNIELAKQIIKEGLSVRQAEQLMRGSPADTPLAAKKKKSSSASHSSHEKNEDVAGLEQSLSDNLGMRVKIEDSDGGGKVTIFFHSIEQLDTILQRLGGNL
jgi:ParB family chromosome partitioning protein